MITLVVMKSKMQERLLKFLIPGARHLFQTIKGPIELADQSFVRGYKTRWLIHINLLLQGTIDKHIVNINLLNIPMISES